MTRFLVLAQGQARRWEKPDGTLPLGLPKHLVPVNGRPLLARTVDQFAAHGQVIVIGPADARYRLPGAELVTLLQPYPTGTSMDKLFATQHLWSTSVRTVILWGDCYYSDEAVDAIVDCDSPDPHWFRRPGPSTITGHPWDESFALSFLPEHHARLLEVAEHVNRELPAHRIHMWNHYALWLGANPRDVNSVARTPHQTHIDDFTDDIDTWEQYCSWLGAHTLDRAALDVAVCVPWYDTGCDDRRAAWDFCRAWWSRQNVYVSDADTRARGRNDAARRAFADGADVIVWADADTVVPIPQLYAAAALAHDTDRYTVAFTEHVRLFRYQLPSETATGHLVLRASAGVGACSRTLFELTGGYDERFRVWGGEDRAFQYVADTLAGQGEAVHGRSWHIWHPADEHQTNQTPEREAQVELALRYKKAAGYEPVAGVLRRTPGVAPNPDEIRALLAEREVTV